MEVQLHDQDGLNARITVTISPADYQPEVDKQLREIRKKARIPGFRPGNAPMQMIQRMAGKDAKTEQVEKLMQKGMETYMKENNLNLIMSPISDFNAEDINWSGSDFEFGFHVGFRPDFSPNVEAINQLTKQRVDLKQDDLEAEIERIRKRYSKPEPIEQWSDEDDVLAGITFTELNEEGTAKGNGFRKLKRFDKDTIPAEIRSLIADKAKGESIKVNIHELLPGDKLGEVLEISAEEAAELSPEFEVRIDTIFKSNVPDMNPDLFKMVFSEDVETEDDFRERTKDQLESYYNSVSDDVFHTEMRETLIKESGIELPYKFIEKFYEANATKKSDDADKTAQEIAQFHQDLAWMLIVDNLMESNELQVTDDDVWNRAYQYVRGLFMNAGMYYATEKQMADYTLDWLKNRGNYSQMVSAAKSQIVFDYLDTVVHPAEEFVSAAAFDEQRRLQQQPA